MPDTWMTVAEAATSLKVHPRTIERRIAGGKVQTRRTDAGLLQVLIQTPDAPDAPDTPAEHALDTVRELAADQVSLATGSASAIVKFAQTDAFRAREDLSIARQDVGRARKSALAAWCVAAVLLVGACGAVGWTASTLTRARLDVQKLTERAEATEKINAQLVADRDNARRDAELARLNGAEASGRLAAYVEQAERRPATRPATLIQRIASALAEP